MWSVYRLLRTSHGAFTSASPLLSSISPHSSFPASNASHAGVFPSPFSASTSDFSSSCLHTSMWPPRAARWSGQLPSCGAGAQSVSALRAASVASAGMCVSHSLSAQMLLGISNRFCKTRRVFGVDIRVLLE